jgi:CubicO group peptidase (beta-lactamase class C family)
MPGTGCREIDRGGVDVDADTTQQATMAAEHSSVEPAEESALLGGGRKHLQQVVDQRRRPAAAGALAVAAGALLLLVVLAATATPSSSASSKPPQIQYPKREWQTSTPASAGLNETRLRASLAALADGGRQIGRVHISRWGRQILLPGSAVDSGNLSMPSPIWSVSKSLCAIGAGLLLTNGSVTLDELLPLSNNPTEAAVELGLPAADFAGAAIGGPLRSLRQFLTMTSDFGLANPLPGRQCAYNNAAVQFYCSTLRTRYAHGALGNSDLDLAERLFAMVGGHQDPLTLNSHHHLPVSGFGGGYNISPRDLARLGLLLLSNGQWEGRPLLSPEWVATAGMHQASSTVTPNPDKKDNKAFNIWYLSQNIPFNSSRPLNSQMGGDEGYGFSLWILPGGGSDVGVHMSGVGGQYVIIDRHHLDPSGLVITVLNNPDPIHHPEILHPHAIDYLSAVREALL